MGKVAIDEPELAKKLAPADDADEASTSLAITSSNNSSSPTATAVMEANEEDVHEAVDGHGGHGGVISHTQSVPWRAVLRNRPVQALAYTHFCNNWFHYTMLAWLPTYFTQSLSLNLFKAAQVSILPPAAAIAA